MAQVIGKLMTPDPVVLPADTPVVDAARAMRDRGIGMVVVETDAGVGILTDRDIVLRAVAGGDDADTGRIGSICSQDIVTIAPESDVEEAVTLMRERAVRRLVVTDDGTPVGVVSLGDLAQERDPHSALGGISRAEPNR